MCVYLRLHAFVDVCLSLFFFQSAHRSSVSMFCAFDYRSPVVEHAHILSLHRAVRVSFTMPALRCYSPGCWSRVTLFLCDESGHRLLICC